MQYAELERRLSELAQKATAEAQHRFALDTIALLRQRAEDVIVSDLTDSERASFLQILDHLDDRPPDDLAAQFTTFHDAMSADEIRAIEFHNDLIELWCAVDAFISFRRNNDPAQIFRIAVSGVNSVDYLITVESDPDPAYSINNMLGSQQMVTEYERQQRLLTSRSG